MKRLLNKKKYILVAVVGIIIGCWIASLKIYDNFEEKGTVENSKDVGSYEETEVIKRKEASYEEWLAAGMVTAISMRYPEFELEGIYLTAKTELSEKEESNGVYVIFYNDEMKMAIYSKPLAEERNESGTIDLYTKDLGFATFDEVSANEIQIVEYIDLQQEDLKDLIKQSLLVSLYEH